MNEPEGILVTNNVFHTLIAATGIDKAMEDVSDCIYGMINSSNNVLTEELVAEQILRNAASIAARVLGSRGEDHVSYDEDVMRIGERFACHIQATIKADKIDGMNGRWCE